MSAKAGVTILPQYSRHYGEIVLKIHWLIIVNNHGSAMLIEATTQTTDYHVYILSDNDDLHIGSGVVIKSLLTDAVTTWSGAHTFTVDGTVIGEDDGINTIGCEAAQTVTIHAGGQIISGGDGVIADADGVILDGVGSTMTNAGIINSYGAAASVFVRDIGTTTVSNSGMMYGRVAGVWHKFGTGTFILNNSGTIESPNHAVLGGESADLVTNTGTMRGIVDLAGGNDVLVNRGGTITGTILGGDGNDRFVLGTSAEAIVGGLGFDTLDVSYYTSSSSLGLTIDLGNSLKNLGSVILNDSYAGIEGIFGSRRADVLRGNTAGNLLLGNAGNDSLSGSSGADTLNGGSGVDTMVGGSGSDCFKFVASTGWGDKINDFTSGADHIVLEGSIFSYGNATGPVSAADFVTGTTRVAHDASDRFIFRTTDATLWYDADGSGSKVSVLVADLQASAILTAADLLLV